MSWGYHLMVDCSGCTGIDSRENIYNFTKDLIKRIDMTAYGEPIIEYLLEGDPKQGYSMLQLITTSNLAGHFMELDSTAYIDVFSCKDFEPGIVETCIADYFGNPRTRVQFVHRQAP